MGMEFDGSSSTLQGIFAIVTGCEVIGAALFLFGNEKLGVDLLIVYLFFTGIVCHHFWAEQTSPARRVQATLGFTQIVTVLGLLLYIRELLLDRSVQQVQPVVQEEEEEEEEEEVEEVEQVAEEFADDLFDQGEEQEEEEEEIEEPQIVPAKRTKSAKKREKNQSTLARIRQRVETIDFGTLL